MYNRTDNKIIHPYTKQGGLMIQIQTVQLAVVPGNVRANWKLIEKEIQKAKQKQVDVLVLPEMCLSGYLIGDIWEQDSFLEECELYGQRIIEASQNLTIVWGNVAVDRTLIGNDGHVRKYNAAFAAYNGKLVSPTNSNLPYTIKTLLPNYRQFDDPRHFTSMIEVAAENHMPIEATLQPFHLPIPSQKEPLCCGIILCEDSWDENYPIRPMHILKDKQVKLFINLSASPFALEKNQKRHRMISKLTRDLQIPMLYVNQCGMQNNGKNCYVFDGQSASYNAQGILTGETAAFNPSSTIFSLNENIGLITPNEATIYASSPSVLEALRYGLSEFLKSIQIHHVVIGVSGGIDSAVNAALYRSILPADQVLLVNLPTQFNSHVTKNLAHQLALNLNCPYVSIPIHQPIANTYSELHNLSIQTTKGIQQLPITSFMQENMQARDRSGRVLASLAAQFQGIFTCNANKTELTVGYGTLYGDLAGAIAATGDLWKHQIYELGHSLNAFFNQEIIPAENFNINPSAELSPAQSIEKGLGDPLIYEYHDYLLKSFIEPWNRATPETILGWYIDGTLDKHLGCTRKSSEIFKTPFEFISDLEKWWNLFSGFSVAKRIQSPPILSVSRRSYGFDLRESQLQPYYTTKYLQLKETLLKK